MLCSGHPIFLSTPDLISPETYFDAKYFVLEGFKENFRKNNFKKNFP